MRKVLDRLLERQRKLLASLEEPVAPAVPAPPARLPQPSPARIAAEDAAIDEALEALEAGDMVLARQRLEPFAESACRPRTLTTLARICSSHGSFDEALGLLRQAESLAPTEPKVWMMLADVLTHKRRHYESVQYRRRLAFSATGVPAQAYVDLVRSLLKAAPKGAAPSAAEVRLAMTKLSAAEDASPELKLKMAELVYSFGPLVKDARALYRSALPCPSDCTDVTAPWVRLIDWCTHSGAPFTRLTDEGTAAHRPSIAQLEDVCIAPGFQWVPIVSEPGKGHTALRGFAAERLRLHSEDRQSPVLMSNSKLVELRLPDEMPTIEEPALLVGGTMDYYHHTIEHLTSLAVSEAAGVGRGLPLVVSDDLALLQYEQLALLGYGEDRLIKVNRDRPVRFRRLTVVPRLVQGAQWVDPLIPRWYRERFAGPIRAAHRLPRKLFLLPSSGAPAQLANQEAVVSLLVARGFEAVSVESMDLRSRIALFGNATHIVSSSHARLTDMVFASPGVAVLTFHHRHLISAEGDIYFDALAAACGHRFHALGCVADRLRSGQKIIDADIIVDLEATTAALDALEKGESPSSVLDVVEQPDVVDQ